MSRVSCINESCHMHEWVVSLICVCASGNELDCLSRVGIYDHPPVTEWSPRPHKWVMSRVRVCLETNFTVETIFTASLELVPTMIPQLPNGPLVPMNESCLVYVCVCVRKRTLLPLSSWYPLWSPHHEVATISKLHKNMGLFCKRALQKRPVFCKKTSYFPGANHS